MSARERGHEGVHKGAHEWRLESPPRETGVQRRWRPRLEDEPRVGSSQAGSPRVLEDLDVKGQRGQHGQVEDILIAGPAHSHLTSSGHHQVRRPHQFISKGKGSPAWIVVCYTRVIVVPGAAGYVLWFISPSYISLRIPFSF